MLDTVSEEVVQGMGMTTCTDLTISILLNIQYLRLADEGVLKDSETSRRLVI